MRTNGSRTAAYKTELHCHSAEGSGCAHEYAPAIVDKYIAAGYTTLCLTNHLLPRVQTWQAEIDRLYTAYETMKSAAGDRLNVLIGAELRFVQNVNDYLVFGFDDNFFAAHPEIPEMGIGKFSALARENGLWIIQAHPFRDGMTVTNPAHVDAIEIMNGHPGHDSRNDMARSWAEKYGKPVTTGTDHHNADHMPRGGIITGEKITCEARLVDVLKSGSYELII